MQVEIDLLKNQVNGYLGRLTHKEAEIRRLLIQLRHLKESGADAATIKKELNIEITNIRRSCEI